MSDLTPTTAAKLYLEHGWQPLPVIAGGKRPISKNWQEGTLNEADVEHAFAGRANVGIRLGNPSGGLVDIDIDSELTLRLTHLLPPTGMVHGRTGKPRSHFWYQIDGASPKTAQLKHPVTGEMIIELRSTGAQTVVPPSQYADNTGLEKGRNLLSWETFGSPGKVTAYELAKSVAKIAAITLIAGDWNRQGSRHAAALALSGMLLRGSYSQEEATQFIEAVCEASEDDEVADRVATVAYTAERIASNEPATGGPSLSKLLDPVIVSTVQKWLDLKSAQSMAGDAPFVWDTPLTFDKTSTPEICASLLPGIYGEFAKALANSAEVSESMTTMSVLGIIAAVCSKKFIVSPQAGWNEPVNLYILMGLPPANNKSLIQGSCTAPIDHWEAAQCRKMESAVKLARSKRKNEESQIQSLRATAAKCKDHTKQQDLFAEVNELEAKLTEIPALPQIYLNDVTPETLSTAVCEQGGRIAIISDEGGIMETMAGLYSKGQSNYDILLKGIDGGRVRLKRKDRDLDICPYLSFLLVVQPQIIRNMSDRKSFQGRGLFERFLYVLPQSRLGYRQLDQAPLPAVLTRQYRDAINALLNIAPANERGIEYPHLITLSEEAKTLWRGFRREIEIQLRPDGKLSPCLGWGGKIVGFTLRLAALLHIAESFHKNLCIQPKSMDNAIAMARLLIDHALAAFGLMQECMADEDAQTILGWIVQQGESRFRRTDCLRKFHGRFTSKKRFDEALAVLIDRCIISPVCKEITTERKRPTLYYEVNPKIVGKDFQQTSFTQGETKWH